MTKFDEITSSSSQKKKEGEGWYTRMRFSSRKLLMILTAGGLVPLVVVIFTMETDSDRSNAVPIAMTPSVDSERHSYSTVDTQWWKRHIRSTCDRLNLSSSRSHLDATLFQKFFVDDKYKLVYCQIPKVASTTWRRVLLFLTGRLNISDPVEISANDAHHKYDSYLTSLSGFTPDEIKYRLENYFKFVIVREPYERLLSAFRNKLEPNTKSAEYFRKKIGKKIIQWFRENPSKQSLEKANDVTFSEFVQYLIDPERKIKMNEHWEKFHKLCHPCYISYDFIGKLHTIERDSQYILDRTGASTKVKFPTRSESRYKTKTTESLLTKYYSQIPKSNLMKLHEEYKADFEIFNFDIPEDIVALRN